MTFMLFNILYVFQASSCIFVQRRKYLRRGHLKIFIKNGIATRKSQVGWPLTYCLQEQYTPSFYRSRFKYGVRSLNTGVTNMGLAIMFSQKTFFSLLFYQHSGPEIKLLLELRDEDMDRHEILLVGVLHVPNNVRQPLKLLLVTGHPQEITWNLNIELLTFYHQTSRK